MGFNRYTNMELNCATIHKRHTFEMNKMIPKRNNDRHEDTNSQTFLHLFIFVGKAIYKIRQLNEKVWQG